MTALTFKSTLQWSTHLPLKTNWSKKKTFLECWIWDSVDEKGWKGQSHRIRLTPRNSCSSVCTFLWVNYNSFGFKGRCYYDLLQKSKIGIVGREHNFSNASLHPAKLCLSHCSLKHSWTIPVNGFNIYKDWMAANQFQSWKITQDYWPWNLCSN